MEKNLLLPMQLRDALINYLATQPYKEVSQLIAVLMNLSEVPNATKENKNG